MSKAQNRFFRRNRGRFRPTKEQLKKSHEEAALLGNMMKHWDDNEWWDKMKKEAEDGK